MKTLEANPALMIAAAKTIAAASRGIDGELATLTSAATALRGAWSGEAQVAYDGAQRRFTASMTERARLIDEITRAVQGVAQAYADADLVGQQALGPS
ncbi:MAG: hypothetical protein B7X41_21495 [Microbacterium sp. 14-71-5]|jgi:WXG100 family type VII secretion target|uniref:WXG100 family type VII secretion target n=1 Tax=Microbacterium sp. 13-71-7 TaxID=1970399 RepID=UPI000BDBF87D|nr:WXG100 family type VII secretion target [Microbacterium sp. 13-71-7]OZB76861.1 MAG: hypothetical protein B7X41_21495 [Microbacterium sp. 14-71-5]OZB80629.1 MAG: hypothetical protein B7X32_18950 [Microbacterium sp. 13-71-7]